MSHVEYDVEYVVMKGSDILSELIVLDSVYMYMYLLTTIYVKSRFSFDIYIHPNSVQMLL